jgi:hypothetical protein
MKNALNLLAILTLIAIFSGCKKDEYQPKGDYQEAGDYPEMSSQISTISVWTYSSPSYFGEIYNSEITQDVLDNGAVLVYANSGTNTWSQLPVTFYQSSSYSTTLEVVTYPNTVRIYWTDSDLTQPATPPAMTFKVVVFTPKMLMENPGIDFKNINEVEEVLLKYN